MNKDDKQAIEQIFVEIVLNIEQIKTAIETQEERLNKIERKIRSIHNDKYSYDDEVY